MPSLTRIKARYYSKEVLKYLLLAGVVTIASILSPQLPYHLLRRALSRKKIDKKRGTDCFRYLRKRGLIALKPEGHDICITLTQEGEKRAGKHQIDELRIARPKQWDGKWRVVIFDIPSTSDVIRNVFRRKLKELGFYPLQKSTWVYPFECGGEITLLREFLGAGPKQIRVLEVNKIEDDRFLKTIFHL